MFDSSTDFRDKIIGSIISWTIAERKIISLKVAPKVLRQKLSYGAEL